MIPYKPHMQHFERNRDVMYAIAYRMLGSLADAEDVIQDTYFRWQDTDLARVDSPRSYLATAVSRLCIDKLRRRKVEKLNYTGPWLPEPMPSDEAESFGPEDHTMKAESISIAFLFLLEKLSPLERAVFILKEAFDTAHTDIAEMLEIEVAWSRQLLRRAKAKLGEVPLSTHATPDEQSMAVMRAFAEAAQTGDMDALKATLTEDVVSYSDGGGRVSAALIPLEGIDRVSRVFMHVVQKNQDALSWQCEIVNGGWGLVAYEGDTVSSVVTVQIEGDRIARIYIMRNPEKLSRF